MIKKILQDNFLRNNLVFFAGSMIVALLNYLYHPVLGRMMALDDFGEVQALISLYTQMAIVVGIFSVTTVNLTSNLENKEERSEIISELRNISLYITGAIFLVIVIFSRQLESFFNFKSFYPFLILAILLITSAFSAFRSAFLQGCRRFKAVSASNIIAAAGKLLFGVSLVYSGWQSGGALAGIIIAQIFALAYLYFKTKHDLKLTLKTKINFSPAVRQELKYGLLVFFSTSCITFLYTADIIFIKHYFDPSQAGLYSGIATIARIIFFAAGPIAAVLLPSIKIKNSRADNRKFLNKSLILVALAGGIGCLTFSLFSDNVIGLLIGHKYVELAYILPRLSLLLFLVSLANIFFYYFLAMRDYFLIPISIISVFSVSILTVYRHDNFLQIIDNFLIGLAVIFTLLIIKYIRANKAI